MLTKILLWLGVVSNIATLVGLWIAYISAPTFVQEQVGHGLLVGGAVSSVVVYLLIAVFVLRAKNAPAERTNTASDENIASLRAAEQRIAKLEQEIQGESARRESELPAARPKIVPVEWGPWPDGHYGLIVRNDGEPALDISVKPVSVGVSQLRFWDRVYPRLTKADGKVLIDAQILLSHGGGTTGSALRDLMIEANLDAVPLTIRYSDLDYGYVTTCEVVREFWGNGLRISSVQQRKATSAD
jgi:hypothetical protein